MLLNKILRRILDVLKKKIETNSSLEITIFILQILPTFCGSHGQAPVFYKYAFYNYDGGRNTFKFIKKAQPHSRTYSNNEKRSMKKISAFAKNTLNTSKLCSSYFSLLSFEFGCFAFRHLYSYEVIVGAQLFRKWIGLYFTVASELC